MRRHPRRVVRAGFGRRSEGARPEAQTESGCVAAQVGGGGRPIHRGTRNRRVTCCPRIERHTTDGREPVNADARHGVLQPASWPHTTGRVFGSGGTLHGVAPVVPIDRGCFRTVYDGLHSLSSLTPSLAETGGGGSDNQITPEAPTVRYSRMVGVFHYADTC